MEGLLLPKDFVDGKALDFSLELGVTTTSLDDVKNKEELEGSTTLPEDDMIELGKVIVGTVSEELESCDLRDSEAVLEYLEVRLEYNPDRLTPMLLEDTEVTVSIGRVELLL